MSLKAIFWRISLQVMIRSIMTFSEEYEKELMFWWKRICCGVRLVVKLRVDEVSLSRSFHRSLAIEHSR